MSDTERIDRSGLVPDNHDTDIAALHEGTAVTPENVIDALSKLVLYLPDGLHVFQLILEGEQMYLKKTTAEISGSSAQFIEVVRHEDTVNLGHLNTVRFGMTSSKTVLRFEILSGNVHRINFLLIDNLKMLEAHSTNDEVADAWIHVPLVGNTTALNLNYLESDDGVLKFTGLNQKLAPEQIQLLLKNGTAPELDLQQLIYKWMESGSAQALRMIEADLTFEPSRSDYNPQHSNVYLAKTEESQSLEEGAVISGVAITIVDEIPFRIDVALQAIKEIDFNYSYGLRKAVKIEGTMVVSNGIGGKITKTGEFIVHADTQYLRENMQLIPSAAFATFSLAELMEMA